MYHITIITIISIFDKLGGLGVARFSCFKCANETALNHEFNALVARTAESAKKS